MLKYYIGRRTARGAHVEVVEGAASRTLDLRRDLADKSTEPEWGYCGSGPAQLALALVADATGNDEIALSVFQEFKRTVVAGLDERAWVLDADHVEAEAARLCDPNEAARGRAGAR